MKKEEINNEAVNEESFTDEELLKLNEILKSSENIELPEKLSKENIKNLLKKESLKTEKFETQTKEFKKQDKKLFKRMIAAAAVFAIVATSVIIAKPWDNGSVKKPGNNQQVTVVEDYSEVEGLFEEYQTNYRKSQLFNNAFDMFGGMADSAIKEESAVGDAGLNMNAGMGSTGNSLDRTESSEFGETNEQVEGVNEADILKNDGEYIYVVPKQKNYWEYLSFLEYGKELEETTSANGTATEDSVYVSPGYNPNEKNYENLTEEDFINKVFIIGTNEKGSLKKCAAINVGEHKNAKIKYSEVAEIFVDGNRLVAILDCYSEYSDDGSEKERSRGFYGDYKMVTCIVSYDITNRNSPVEEWRVYQDGDYLSARKIDNKIVTISNYYVPLLMDGAEIKDYCIPEVYFGENACRIPASDICVMGEVKDSSYVVVSSLDVTNCEESFNSSAVLGGGENVYCSKENLYITSGRYETTVSEGDDAVAEIFMIDSSSLYTTEILKFDISGEKVEYKTKGKVNGTALNQFSIDEYNNYLRIATTTGFFADAQNNLYVLDENMVIVGMVEGLAEGETIKSVRFMQDTAYVVTFKQTDPLFVIDLTNPELPEVLGELKIPGFSNYLHPVSEKYLLGIGVNGTEEGAGNGMKVSLFDVSDKKNPKEVAKFELTPQPSTDNVFRSLTSAAFSDHKAVCWDSKNLIMYIPYSSVTEVFYSEEGSYYSYSEYGFYNSVLALKVDTENGKLIKVNGYGEKSQGGKDYYINERAVDRTTYIDNIVYSFAQYGSVITSFDKSTAKKISSIVLE